MKKLFIPVILISVIAFAVIMINQPAGSGESPGGCGETDAPCDTGITPLAGSAPQNGITVRKGVRGGVLPVVMFYTWDCPHCRDAQEFFALLTGSEEVTGGVYASEIRRYRESKGARAKIDFIRYEIKRETGNRDIFQAYADNYSADLNGVPSIFIGDLNIVGFYRDRTPAQVVDALLSAQGITAEKGGELVLPLFGSIDAAAVSLPLLAAVIGFLDGFNPCAMWVLFFLLGILVYAASRKKVFFIGMIFVAASGGVYFAFMAAWFNVFMVIGFSKVVTVILACAAIGMGLVNLKELFFFKKGVSLMISDSAKPKLYKKVRHLNSQTNFLLMTISTVVLAVFVNFIELACTAGFPAVFTKILAERQEPIALKYWYMVMYNLFYVLPLFIIVIVFTVTMGHYKLGESKAKLLKTVSGIVMVILGILLLVRPGFLLG